MEDMKLGRNLARTFLDYYKLQNYIIFKPSTITMKNTENAETLSINSMKQRKNQTTNADKVNIGTSYAKLGNMQTEELPKSGSRNTESRSQELLSSANLEQFFSLDDG